MVQLMVVAEAASCARGGDEHCSHPEGSLPHVRQWVLPVGPREVPHFSCPAQQARDSSAFAWSRNRAVFQQGASGGSLGTDGTTPCAWAQAARSPGLKQQQCCQQSSALRQPQAWAWQGKG